MFPTDNLTSCNEKVLTTNELYHKLIAHSNEQTKVIKDEIQASINEVSNKVSHNSRKLQEISDRCLHFERVSRRNNIIIFGLKRSSEDDLLETTLSALNEYLKAGITTNDINNIRTIGRGQQQPVILEFVSLLKKKAVLKNVKNLKGTGIGIGDDLCKEDREKNKVLVRYLKKARGEGAKAYIRGNRLCIDGKEYTVEDLQNSEGESVTESEDGDLEPGLVAALTKATNVARLANCANVSRKKSKVLKTSPPKAAVATRSKGRQNR